MTDQIDDLKVSVRDGEVLLSCFGEEWRLDGRETRKLICDLQEALEALQVTARRTGRTTKQILAAQHRAVLLTRDPLGYVIRLLKHLNRRDLIVLPVSALNDSYRFMDRGISEFIIDHAVILSKRERAALDWLRLLTVCG